MRRKPLTLVFLAVVYLLMRTACAQEAWPRFRGADATGVSPDNTGLPSLWSKTENVVWKKDIPGWGWSNPIVWGNRVFLTTVVSDKENTKPEPGLYLGEGVRDPAPGVHHWMVYCFDLNTGKELWKREAHTGEPKIPRHPKSTYAAETPATDGQRVYVLFGDVGLYCYDMDGNPVWQNSIEPKKTFMDYGAAASPVVHDGRVIVVYDNMEKSWLASIDAKTGQEKWRVDREETHSWATPLIWKNRLRTEIVVNGKNANRSYSLDGKLLWEFEGNMSTLVIPSPFAAHGMCYIGSGYVGDQHRPTFAIKPGASGDITPEGDDFADNEYIEWYQGRSAPYNTSQIVYGDYLYTLYDRGFLTCHDAKTGEQVYGKRRFAPAGTFTSSPWAYNGYLFCLSEKGLTYVVEAGSEFRIVGRNDLDELCLASPSAVGDKLLLRTASQLYCISGGKNARDVAPDKLAGPALDIWAAISEGNLAAVNENLAHDPKSLTASNPLGGSTTLATAALNCRPAIVKLLLEKGADVNAANPDGNTPLHVATFVAHEEIVEMLIDKGADLNAKNKKGESPMNSVKDEWTDGRAGIYKYVGNLIDRDFDIERIKAARPKVAELLRQAQQESTADKVNADIPARFREAKEEMAKAVADGKCAGVAHLVVKDNEVIYHELSGCRDIEEQLPFTKDTIVRMYSMSKPITSAAAMTLYEQGKFQLDDPISKFIPAFKNTLVFKKDGDPVPAQKPITVRDVFCHMTGYGYSDVHPDLKDEYGDVGMKYRSPKGMFPPDMSIEAGANALAKIPAMHEPGEKFTYGFSTDLLGRLIEVWSGKPFDEYLNASVLHPLDMVDTSFQVPADKRNRFATCHTMSDNKLGIIDKYSTSPYNDGFKFLSGGGGLVSTMQDYANFCQMMIDGGEFKGKRILKPETVKLMFTDHIGSAGGGEFHFGLGFSIQDIEIGEGESKRTAKQYAWGGYASTDFKLVPEEKLFQIVIRQRVPSAHELSNRMIKKVYEGIE